MTCTCSISLLPVVSYDNVQVSHDAMTTSNALADGSFYETYSTHLPSLTTIYSGSAVSASLSDVQPIFSRGQRDVSIVSRLACEQQHIEVATITSTYRTQQHNEANPAPDSPSCPTVCRVEFDCYEGRLPRRPQSMRYQQDKTDEQRLTCVAHSSLPVKLRPDGSSSAVEAFLLRRIESSDATTGVVTNELRNSSVDPSNPSLESSTAESEQRPKQHRRHGSGSSTRVADALQSESNLLTDGDSRPPKSTEKAILVVSGLTAKDIKTKHDPGHHVNADIMRTCELPLQYLPLSVRMANISQRDGSESIGIFVASAEDTRLRLYMPNMERNAVVLEEVSFSLSRINNSDNNDGKEKEEAHDMLDFSSPIMAIDCSSAKHTRGEHELGNGEDTDNASFFNYLALGCQDGIVRVCSFSYNRDANKHAFSVIGYSDLVVDGPVVTLHLSARTVPRHQAALRISPAHRKIDLIVGSLCGFACHYSQTGDISQPFTGPKEIISNLWCGRIDAEDGVLCVKSVPCNAVRSGYAIVLGTYSGRVLAFEPSSTGEYMNFWNCQLPYPIHGVTAADLDGDGLAELLITTRRSLHIFHCRREDVAAAAKQKMAAFLSDTTSGD